MSRHKKNTTLAQTNSEMHVESALKLFPQPSQTIKESDGPIDKDGYDGDDGLTNVIIDFGLNGYMVSFIYDNMPDEKYVFTDFDEVIECIRKHH